MQSYQMQASLPPPFSYKQCGMNFKRHHVRKEMYRQHPVNLCETMSSCLFWAKLTMCSSFCHLIVKLILGFKEN
jgi:hypothetical protein